jgi:hypothetical protein
VKSLRLWVDNHIWTVATAGVAAIVFGVTFVAVSTATSSGSAAVSAVGPADSDRTRDASAETTRPAGLDTDDAAAAVALPAQEDADLDDPIEVKTDSQANAAQGDQDPELDVQETVIELDVQETVIELDVQEAVIEPPASRPLPEFDEESLTFGGSGTAGAILGGPGIVQSSGVDRETPWEFILPSAKIRADVVRIGLTFSNALGAPDNPEVIGWWEAGPAPGEPGNVLLDGHRDYTDIDDNVGTGVCWLLLNTNIGDFIIIRDAEAETNYLYTVIETTSVAWNDNVGVEYLQPTHESRLTLVTCEGSFDEGSHNYSNRRILVAELTDRIPFATDEAGAQPDPIS